MEHEKEFVVKVDYFCHVDSLLTQGDQGVDKQIAFMSFQFEFVGWRCVALRVKYGCTNRY